MTFVAEWISTGSRDAVTFRVPADYRTSLIAVLNKCAANSSGYVTLTLDAPKRPRTTGERSQNSALWGWCSDIADQLSTMPDQDYTPEQVKAAMCRMAVSEGYPTALSIDGVEEPMPTRHASVEQMSVVLSVIVRFADEHSLYLTEYDGDGIPRRMVGGKTK